VAGILNSGEGGEGGKNDDGEFNVITVVLWACMLRYAF
jgi:hypothetical protein